MTTPPAFYLLLLFGNGVLLFRISRAVALADVLIWGLLLAGWNLLFFSGRGLVSHGLDRDKARRHAAKKLLLIGLGCLLGFALLEGLARLSHWQRASTGKLQLVPHPVRGWTSGADLRIESEYPVFGKIAFSTGRHGFRKWPAATTGKKRVFVIGDSFTQAVHASDGECYYDHLAAAFPDFDFFVFGCGGYGTLQETLALEEFQAEVRPDVILWQFCGNDLIDNVHALEQDSLTFQAHEVRPYLENGRIVNRFSRRCPLDLTAPFQYSRVLRTLLVFYDQLLLRYDPLLSVEYRLEPGQVAEAVSVATAALKRARDQAGGTPILGFCADQSIKFREICTSLAIPYLEGGQENLRRATASGTRVNGLPFDGHWNAAGHRIVGEALAREIHLYLSRLPGH